MRYRAHYGVDFLVRFFGPRMRHALEWLEHAVVWALGGFMVFYGWRIVESSWVQMYPTLPFSVGTGYLVLPIAGVLFILMDCAVFMERRRMITLVIVLVVLLVLGMPVAFSMALATIAGFLVLEIPLETVAQKMMSGIEPFPFVAIPLFVLAGALMETSGISRRLVALATALVGHIRGGLGIVVVASEVLFSGISGSSVADASAIGSILIPR